MAYTLTAAAAVSLTRFDGGVAFLWGSGAILIAALLRTPVHRWHEPALVCATCGLLVTGFLGLGWAAALPFAGANMLEAVSAAWLFKRWPIPRETMRSLGWFFRFVATVGVAAPLLAAVLAAATAMWLGKDGWSTFAHFFTGHSLGNLTFTPLALLVTGRRARRDTWAVLAAKWRDMLAVLGLVLGASVLVFSQSQLPLLFLPILAVILAAVRTGREAAAIAVVVLAIIGAAATVVGRGPVLLVSGELGPQLQFFQFFLAATVLTVLPVSADLQNRSRILRRLRVSEERFRVLAEHSADILMHMSAEGHIRYVSPSMQILGGHSPEQLVGMNGLDFVAPEHVELVRAGHAKVLAGRGEVVSFRYLGLTVGGGKRWFHTQSRALLDEDGNIEGVLSVSRDVMEQVAEEERLQAAALTDLLTGLPNRRAFQSLVQSRLQAVGHGGGDCIALLDIDFFKRVNDSWGHDAGDEVLRGFAIVARRELRQKDVVARLGGEEFAILFPDTSLVQAMQICERLRTAVGRSVLVRRLPNLRVTVSGGVATLGPEGLECALKVADEALYTAKRSGRDQLALAA
jgi:diguanylate cyclase (GGDEF)-like protein/PAS domain S-box-containing protein